MLKINKKVEYALMALKFMASKLPGELTTAREVCDSFGTPFDTTAKVMQAMNTAGILNSQKGMKGGYFLSKNLELISYRQLEVIIEGKDIVDICQTSKGKCELYESCNISTPLDQLNRKVNNFLEELSLKELLQGQEYSRPSQTSTTEEKLR